MVRAASRFVVAVGILAAPLLSTPRVCGGEDLSIEGRVTANSKALPNAEIRLEAATLPEPGRSDAAGRFVVTAPSFGLWHIRVEAPGRLAREIAAEPFDNPIRLPPVDLEAAADFVVRVSDEEGRPVEARLIAYPSTEPTEDERSTPGWLDVPSMAVTDRQGRARVTGSAERDTRLWVQAAGLAPLEIDVPAAATSTGSRDPLELEVRRGAARPISVTDLRGAPLAGVRIHLAEELPPLAVTDSRGKATLAAIPESALDLMLVVPDGGHSRWTLPPAAGEAPAPVTARVAPSLRLRGRVVQAGTGTPLADSPVWVPSTTTRRAQLLVSARTDARGRFELVVAPSFPIQVAAAAADHVSIIADLESSENEVRTLALPPLRAGIGHVVTEDEQPVESADVRLLSVASAAPGSAPAVAVLAHCDTEGRFTLPNPPLGRHDLEVRAPGFAPVRIPGIEIPERRGETDLGVVVLAEGVALEGRIVDPDGAAIGGAEILLTDQGLAPAAIDLLMSAAREKTVSDPDGEFLFRDLARGRVHLQVRRAEYLPTEWTDLWIPTGEPIEIVLQPTASISGWVLDAEGQGVTGALVSVEPAQASARKSKNPIVPNSDPGLHAITGEGGRFSLQAATPGRLSLAVRAGGFLNSRLSDLELSPGETLDGLEITLQRGAEISGVVRDLTGQPVANVLVTVEPTAFTRTTGEGRFELTGLEPGLRSVVAKDDGGRRAEQEVAVSAGNTELELILEGGTEVAGRVRTPTGEPVPAADVTLLDPSSQRPSLAAETDAAGRFVLAAVPRGTYQILVQREGFLPAFHAAPLDVEAAPIRGLEIELPRGSTLRGRISGLPFGELAHAIVRVADLPTVSRLDYEGRFELTGLPSRELLLEILLPGRRIISRRVSLPDNTSESTIEIDLSGEPADTAD